VRISSSGSRKAMNTRWLFKRVTADSNSWSCHSVYQTHRLCSTLISMTAYGHTLTTSQYATSTTYSSIRQMRRTTRSMCAKCCSDLRNSSIAKPGSANWEFRKSASCGLLSPRKEPPWNRTGSPQSRTSRHQSQLEMSRCSSDSRTSTEGSSGTMPRWPFHLQNY